MSEVLFLGGPWNGRHYAIDEPLPRHVLVTSERSTPVADFYGPGDEVDIEPPVDPIEYSLRGLRNRQPVYVAPDYPACDQRPCVVPRCGEFARVTFVAAEPGRLAGRDWRVGDEIRLCWVHGGDVVRAQGVRGVEQLAEWLRPDAKLDLLDYITAGRGYDAEEWADSRRRTLAIRPAS